MPFVSGVIEGYNLTVFAYGISGAGKTFTYAFINLVCWEQENNRVLYQEV